MDYLILLLVIVFFANFLLLLNTFFGHIYVWQVKEYRIDRMKSYFRNEIKLNYGNILYAIFKLIVIFAALNLLNPSAQIFNFWILLADLGIDFFASLKVLQNIIGRRFQFFKKSIRNLIIFIPLMFLIILPYIYHMTLFRSLYLSGNISGQAATPITDIKNIKPDLEKLFNDAYSTPTTNEPTEQDMYISLTIFVLISLAIYNSTLYILSFVLVSLGVFATNPLAKRKRNNLIKKAREKISSMSDLRTIGITGSYGKTSTKEMLVKLLSTKYKVGYTTENMNTEVGVAISILNNLPADSEFFVMEAGAYRKGEIKNCVDIVPLDFAIVTNVGKAHLDIFKTVENIAEAKSELIQGLKPRGKAILNFDNSYTRNMSKLTNNEVLFFHVADEESDYSAQAEENLFCIFNIKWDEPKVEFTIKFKGEEINISTKVVGRHQLKNLAAAILCANLAGLSLKEIQHLLENMIFESSHFRIYEGNSGAKIIDDGYNSNPEGFMSALSHLKIVNTKNKILISKGIPEIGKEIKTVYAGLADKIYNAANIFITTDKNFYEAVNVERLADFQAYLIEDNDKIKKFIKPYLNPESTILIEGRIHPKLKQFICK